MRSVSRFTRTVAAAMLLTSLHAGMAIAAEREPRQPERWFARLLTRIVHIFGDEISVPPHG